MGPKGRGLKDDIWSGWMQQNARRIGEKEEMQLLMMQEENHSLSFLCS